MELRVLRFRTIPVDKSEFGELKDSDQSFMTLVDRDKVIGEDLIEIVENQDMKDLREHLGTLCEKYHPTPIIILNTNELKNSYLIGDHYSKKDKEAIKEVVLYYSDKPSPPAIDPTSKEGNANVSDSRNERIRTALEKRKQLMIRLGVGSQEELNIFFQNLIIEALQKGHTSPSAYVKEEIEKRVPDIRDYFDRIPVLYRDIGRFLANSNSTIICRILGRDWVKVNATAIAYSKYHKLEGVRYLTNEIYDLNDRLFC